MKAQRSPFSFKQAPLAVCIRRILAGSLLASAGGELLADSGLPVAVGAGATPGSNVAELANPALHPTIDVGHASASYSADGQKLTINQTTAKTVLDWRSFNVDAGKSVQFAQPGSGSIALNNIHQLDASKIYGNLSANGQVYLVNANGFVFGQGASVNVNSLVATTLKIEDDVFDKGIANVVDSGATGVNPAPVAALTGDGAVYRDLGNGRREKIRILVENGAAIAAANSGRVLLAAPDVENQGTITAPDGQVMLVGATDKVYLQASDASDVRGLLVEVDTGGSVENVGKILTERGDTTMLGFAVSQQGIVSASTSVALNGSVRLLAREGAQLTGTSNYRLKPKTTTRAQAGEDGLGRQASVVLDGGSLTEVALDASSGTAVNEQTQPRSRIDLEAGTIRLKNGAQIVAHAGDVNLIASALPDAPLTQNIAGNASRIVLEQGSKIDVSGVKNVELAMSSNVVDLELRNYELRDAPLQKGGILHAKTVQVDVREGTTLADASGAIAKQPHSVFERSIGAGTISLQSEGDLVVQAGAKLDISGGYLSYLGGYVNTTQLLSNGRLFDLATADPNRSYQQIVSGRHYEAGYRQGGDAGTISIKAKAARLDGSMFADTVSGLYQRDPATAAAGGELELDLAWSNTASQTLAFTGAANSGGGEDIAEVLALTPALFGHGLNHFNLNTLGRFRIDTGVVLNLAAGGDFKVRAGTIDIQGSLIAPAGDVALTSVFGDFDGALTLGATARIDSSGRWINDIKDGRTNSLQTLWLDGGDIALQAGGGLLLARGASLAANGGARMTATHKVTGGVGGAIALQNNSTAGGPSPFQLGATLSAVGLRQNGALSISTGGIEIADGIEQPIEADGTLYLSSGWLQNANFGAYTLTTTDGALKIADHTRWQLRQTNWQLNGNAMQAASGTPFSELVHLVLLPDYQRLAVDLNLTHARRTSFGIVSDNGGILIGANAWIGADWGAQFALTSDDSLRINGTLSAPAGAINITLTGPNSAFDSGYDPDLGIFLGALSHLNAVGTSVLTPNGSGLLQGDVKAGGTVSLTAPRGYIVAAAGSSIDVSGTQARLDIVNAKGRTKQTLASAGGTINLTAAEGLILQGQLLAQAGTGTNAAGGTASGGTVNLALDTRYRGVGEFTNFPSGDRVIRVGAEMEVLSSDVLTAIAAGVVPAELNGLAYISARQIAQSGADRLGLTVPVNGEIRFEGAVDLAVEQSLSLDAPSLGHAGSGSAALSANVVNLGSSLNRNVSGSPGAAGGEDRLTVNANLINLFGATMIGGFAETHLLSNGDLRMTGINPNGEADLRGALRLAGNLVLAAREIYPTTLSHYTITIDAAVNPDGTVTVLPGVGSQATPLSAAGALTIEAPHIQSQGRLLAPFGSIELKAGLSLALLDGSVTSVGADSVIPFGRTQGGLDWLYPLGTASNIQTATPAKSIVLSGPDINLAAGAGVNLSGGGDLSAFEFIAGAGGSRDVLDTSGAYAILPAYLADFAAYDPIEFAKSGLNFGDNLHLSAALGNPGDANYLAAGDYVLLPAHYALLPNAFLVTPQTDTLDMAAGTTASLIDGTQVIAGYRYTANTSIAASRWSGFAVEAGTVARTRSEYDETTASEFFGAKGAGLPQDAGNLALLAQGRLALAADISATAAAGGLGGMLDIGANKLSVVQDLSAAVPTDGVTLLADQLNRLNVDSLLLGGRRQRNADATQLTVTANSVSIGDGVALQGREVLLAARDRVTVGANASVAASGRLSRTDTELNVANADGSGAGALLRVSAGAQSQIERAAGGLGNAAGLLEVKAGAVLSCAGSILLDGSRDVTFNGTIAMNGGDLALSSSRITLGGDGTAAGLNLSDSTLNGLNADRIALNSYDAIDFAGALQLTVKDLTLNAANLRGLAAGGQTASIVADTITLTQAGRAAAAQTLVGDMLLDLSARTSLTLAEGEYAWSGFGQVALSTGAALIDDGTATINSTADLAVTAPVWTANAGANTVIELGGHDLTVSAGNGGALSGGLGARLTVNARDIQQQGRIELAAGGVALNASRDLTVGGNIDAAGRVVNLADAVAYAGGGYISLTAEQGKLAILNGARLDVSGSSLGGDAGSLNLAAANGELTLDGSLAGRAYSGAVGGSLALDSQNLSPAQWAGLLGQLHGGGFNGDIAIRQRLGDITITADQSLQAANITLAADSGSLTVAGELSVSGAQAGKLQLAAGDALTILAGAKLGAVSSGTDQAGGTITLTSTDADGDGLEGVAIASGAALDLSGAAGGGEVDVIVNRKNDDDAAVDIAAGSVAGAASLKVAAMAHFTTDAITNAQIKQWYNDTRAFMTAAADNTDLNGRLGGFTLQPGLDVQGSGSLDLNLSENLATATWTRVGSTTVWRTKLDNIAGAVQALRRLNADGEVIKEYSYFSPTSSNSPCTLTSCSLNAGTYYFDANPNSSTYRTLFLRAGTSSTNPRTLSGLTEFNGWDLALPYANGQDWHFGAEKVPGLLVIRAAENLNINQNLSDGIARYDGRQLNALLGTNRAWGSREVLQTGESWSYQLVAGADLSSANLMGLLRAPASDTGNLTVGSNSRVRTGTGTIAVAAAGDIKLSDWTSAIYTMGRAESVNRYGSLTGITVGNEFFVEYPIDGGDLSLKAGGDIVGAVSSQFLSDWLQHASVLGDGGNLTGATAWGISFDAPATVNGQNQSFGFRENIGALGGGNIDVNAGRDILDLSVMLPTSAKLTGGVDADGNIAESPPLIRGGGDLNLRAGGDIAGGVFFVDKGIANIKADGAITASRVDPDATDDSVVYSAGPIFAIADAVFNLHAATGIAVGAVLNPFGVPPATTGSNTAIVNSYFFNYGPSSGIALQTLAGDIDFNNDVDLINELAKTFPTATSDPLTYISLAATDLMSYYPGNLTAHALSGNININNTITLLPSADGTLELAAWSDLTLGIDPLSNSEIRQLDADPYLMPSALHPTNTGSVWPEHADVSVHANDRRSNRLIAAHGSITGIGAASVITAKATTVYAGLDFKNLGLTLQNLHAHDVSSISAGRDILYELLRNPTTGAFNTTNAQVELGGPGLFNVWAGRNIDLGVSGGLISVGNLHNVALPSQGADISVLAGSRFGDSTAPLEDFLNTYVVSGTYQSLRASLDQQTTPIGRLQIALAVLFDEIRASAKAAAVTTGTQQQAAYQRGYDALALLFPEAPAGDIKLFFSRIQTLQGGDINLLAPGGMVNVGLASGFTGGKADQANLGIIVQREGDINVLVKNDLQVNQQRVFTLDAGDITVWSSEGNIDAGRGAKAALATAAPRISIDKTTGQLIVEFPPTISGSGIRAQSGYNSDRIGNVVLAAPKGVVDAGEAGIGGQNVTIAATAVIGASNIQALGSSIGFGQVLTPPAMPDGAGAAAAAASRSAPTQEEAAEQQTGDSAAGRSVKVALLDSQLLGFGACSVADIKSGKAGCGE